MVGHGKRRGIMAWSDLLFGDLPRNRLLEFATEVQSQTALFAGTVFWLFERRKDTSILLVFLLVGITV